MAFDPAGNFVRPGGFRVDQANGAYFTSERADQELDAVADALSSVKKAIPSGPVFNPALYYTKTEQDQKLGQKQDALGYTPINTAEKGVAGGVVPLNAQNQIDPQYLPTTATVPGGTAGVMSFNGRTGIIGLLPNDVSGALGFQPAPEAHSHHISDVAGLQAALNSKHPALGFNPARDVHQHDIGDVTGLQAILNNVPQVYTGNNVNETVFPIGHTLLANLELDGNGDYIAAQRNELVTIRLAADVNSVKWSGGVVGGTLVPQGLSYTTATVGTIVSGQWRSRGTIGTTNLFQRVS
jgi:hypothetical protein